MENKKIGEKNRGKEMIGGFCVVLGMIMLSFVGANGANVTMYIEDYGVDPGATWITIPVDLNVSSGSNPFGTTGFNVTYDGNILNASNYTKGPSMDAAVCNITVPGVIQCGSIFNSAGIQGDFTLVNITFNITQIGVKTDLNISIGVIADKDGNGYSYSIKNGSVQINCTNDTQCGANNTCNITTHLCQATTIICYGDADGDGYGNATNTTQNTTCPTGYVNNSNDCNDNNSAINPNTIWFADMDNDGYGNATNNRTNCTKPAGTWIINASMATDCNDNNSAINPNTIWYADNDTDGYGNAAINQTNCTKPSGNWTLIPGDCNDNNLSIHPGTPEIYYDGVDNDCNVSTKDCDQDNDGFNSTVTICGGTDCNDTNSAINPNTIWYADNDTDGYGNAAINQTNCTKPSGNWTLIPGDCNDNNLSIHPGTPEIYYDGVDNDCNVSTKDCDQDNDGFNSTVTICGGTDCNDTNSAINPNTVWYADNDTDGYGNAAINQTNCTKPSGNWVLTSGDCNDTNSTINPNTIWYADNDTDGYGNAAINQTNCTKPSGNWVLTPGDCNDNNNATYPGAPEIYNGVDDNCVNGIDEGFCDSNKPCSSGKYCGTDHICHTSSTREGYTGSIDLAPTTPATNATQKEFSGVPGESEGLTVTLNLGKDAKGAQVTATVGNKTSTATANDNGTVTITLPGFGQGEITATKTGFKTLTKTINVYAGTLNITKISGEKYGDEFKFKVTTKDGSPVKDAEVEIYGEKLKTDAKGIITKQIKEIRSGLEASASAKDYKGSSISFDVKAIGKLGFEGIPEKVKQGDTITITVTDENKKPVPNAKVTINGVEKTADADGKIEYAVTTRSLTLKASNDGYIPSEQTSVSVEPKIECGDGKCEAGETKENCPNDCIKCGDGVCDKGETSENCVGDCPKSEGFPLWIIGILLVIVLIAAYYFLVMKKKKEE